LVTQAQDFPSVKKLLILLVLVVLALAGGVYVLSHNHSLLERLNPPAEAPRLEPSAQMVYGQLLETVTGSGLVQPQRSLIISTDQSGRVVNLLHEVNDSVQEGDELLQLDDRVPKQRLKQAQATLATAEAKREAAEAGVKEARSKHDAARIALEREQEALRNMTGTQKAVEQRQADLAYASQAVVASGAMLKAARAGVAEAKELVAMAELGVDLTHVRVPTVDRPQPSASGGRTQDLGRVLHEAPPDRPKRRYTILERKVSLNQLIGPPVSGQLFVLTPNAEELELNAQIAESDIHKVAKGQQVYFTVSAYEDHTFTGQVTEVKPLPNVIQGSTLYTAVVTIDAPPGRDGSFRLHPGMTAATLDVVTRRVPADGKGGVWLVPEAALNLQVDKEFWDPDVKEAPAAGDTEKWVWVTDNDRTCRPLVFKPGVGGKVLDAHAGLGSETYTEVKDWITPVPGLAPGKPAPRVLTGAPPSKKKGGFLQLPSLMK
jgi:HlyD family secretion protein